jgi:glycosyltransferase involved in cell wall biosynthesis
LAALSLAKGQRRIGIDARIVLGKSEHSTSFVARAKGENVPAVEIAELPLGDEVSFPRRVFYFRAAAATFRPHVLHLHTGGLACRTSDVLGACMSLASVRLATVHWPSPWPPGSRAVQGRWRLLTRLLDHVLCPSQTSRQEQLAAGIPSNKVTSLPNAIDVEQFAQGQRDAARRELGVGKDDLLVLFLARVEAQKRPLDAIRAFRRVATTIPNAKMAIVGRGDLEEECRRLAIQFDLSDRISIAGYRTDTADLMRAGDVYLLPTEFESFGMTVAEAMAAGTPVVTSRIAPLVGEIIPEDCAIFVGIGDIQGLSDAIIRLLETPSLRGAMAERARSYVRRRYGLEGVAREHVKLYNELLARKGRRRRAVTIEEAASMDPDQGTP